MNNDKIRTKVTIPAKVSGRGSIYDLERNFDIEIRFVGGLKYAVLVAGYYFCTPYLFNSRKRAIKFAREQIESGYDGVRVIDYTGKVFEVIKGFGGDILVPVCFGTREYPVENI